jgi:transposase-like protein
MVTTLTLGGLRCVYIRKDRVIKSTVRKVAAKDVMLKKVCLRAVFQTLLLWVSHFIFRLPVVFSLVFEIIIIALPLCYFFLWRSKSIAQIKALIILSNGLNQLCRLGLWVVFFHALKALVSFPLILGMTQKVEISKEANKYKVCVNVPITYWFNSDSSLDRDIVMAILNEARGPDGQKIIAQQALAEGFGLKDRREVDNRMQRYRKSGHSLMGIVAPHISRASVLTEEIKQAIQNFWAQNWWATEREVFEIMQHIGLFKPDAKFCPSTIRAAVSCDFLKLRAQVKKTFTREFISYKNDELVKQLFDLVQNQYDLLKAHDLVPKIEQLKLEALKAFSKTNTLKKELKQTARIKNIQTQILNPQIQPHLPKPLQAIKLYGYFACSYGRIAYHMKVSKSTVFYWVQSFILCLQITFFFPSTCSGTIGFDAKWVKITKSYSTEEKIKGKKWRYVFVAVDCHTYDLLHIQIFPTEDKKYTKLFLWQLKSKGFDPKAIITDMNPAYTEPIKQVFPKAQHAICIFHLLQAAHRHIKKVFGKDYKNNKKVCALKKEIYHLFDAKDKRTVIKRMQSLMAKKNEFLSLNPKADKIFNCIQAHFDQALLSIGNPQIPHTNNASERAIKKFNYHYKNMAGFESMATARDYLTLFAFFYRTTAFYEAKDKQIRGLAPLQIAGVDISTIPAVKAFGLL